MSMKQGFCIKCHTDDPKRRVFKVNSEAEKCYCPHCMAEYKPKVAISYFDRFLRSLNEQADLTLQIAKTPDASYLKYAEVLEFEEDYVPALLGRISSLLYLSTLRTSRFKDAMLLIDLDKDRFHLVSSREMYLDFLKSCDDMANSYKERLSKKLTYRSLFYDVDCIKLYIQRLLEIIEFKNYLKEELIDLKDEETANRIAEEIKEIENLTHEILVSVEGRKYKFISLDQSGVPFIAISEDKIKVGLKHYPKRSLHAEEKKTRYINDTMFKTNKTLYTIIKLGLGFGIALGAIGLILLILSLILNNTVAFWPLLILGISFSLVGMIFVGIQFILRARIKKSRY